MKRNGIRLFIIGLFSILIWFIPKPAYAYMSWDYSNLTSTQTLTIPYTGWYQIEAWGGKGGSYNGGGTGGNGGYIKGRKFLYEGDVLSIQKINGGLQAGGDGTIIKLNGSLIAVAGGGGGGGSFAPNISNGGKGGGLVGETADNGGGGGTQSCGGQGYNDGGYLYGGNGGSRPMGPGGMQYGGGGGAGYYGGGGGSICVGSGAACFGGGGGSSYVGGFTTVLANQQGTSSGNVRAKVAYLDYVPTHSYVSWDYANFSSTQTFTAPYTGCYQIEAWGEKGGDYANGVGGNGGYVKGMILLNLGEVLTIQKINGGDNGGGDGTIIKLNGSLIAASGGGGAAGYSEVSSDYNGGKGGGHAGETAEGGGGTQNSGGAAGRTFCFVPQAGSYLSGGDGKEGLLGRAGYAYGGGGGAGYYGGGGSVLGGGGGGSSYVGGLMCTLANQRGTNSGNIRVLISYVNELPTIYAPTLTAINPNQIRIAPNLSTTNGLASIPYLYNRNNTDIPTWIDDNPYNDTGLAPNTEYTYKYKVKDSVGNISAYSATASKFTKALNPSNVTCTNETAGSLTVNITTASGQGQSPQYYLKLKLKGSGISGANQAYSSWSTSTTRTLTGLAPDTEYELWLYTRNGDNVSNSPYLAISSMKTDSKPTLNNTTPNNQFISGNNGYSEITVSGSVRDTDSGDTLTIYYRVDGATGESGQPLANSINANGSYQSFSETINLDYLTEGSHTLNIWVEDDKGGKSAESNTSFSVDRTFDNVGNVTINALSANQISVQANNASDSSGLAAAPYLFNRNGIDILPWTTSPFTDQGLEPNTEYTYKYKAKDALENTSNYSGTVSKYTLANIPVNGVTGAITTNQIQASWEANGNPAGTEYALAAFNTSNELVCQNAWTSNLTDTLEPLSANTQYTIKVQARNGDNIETGWLEIGTVSTLPVIPSIPQNLSATPYQDSITLSWGASEGATKYYIYENGSEIAQTENLSYEHTGLLPESTHTYTIKAWNLGGFSASSTELIVTTPPEPPLPPDNINMTSLKDQITISWSPVEGATKYYIDCDGQITDIGTNTSYTHTGLLPGTPHTYKVKAERLGVGGIWSTSILEHTLLNTPSNVVASATNHKISIWWSAVDGASSYDVNIGGNIENITDTSYSIEGLDSGTTYTYSIKAKNSITESQWSEERTKYTLTNPPSTPTDLEGDSELTSINLTWDNVTDATGYDLKIDGYITNVGDTTAYIHTGLDPDSEHTYRARARNSGGKSAWSNLISLSTLSLSADVPENLRTTESENAIIVEWDLVDGATEYDLKIDDSTQIRTTAAIYTHEGLAPGSEHTYQVRSINNGEPSDWSPVLTTQTRTNLYPIPEDLSADVESTSITVSWDEVPDAMGYDIETDGEIQEDIVDTSYVHTGLSSESVHTYRVRTINDGGERGDWSETLIAATLTGIPESPQNLTAVAYTDKIIISWEPNEEADSYNIRTRSESAINVTDAIYIDSGLAEETEYTYSVQTVKESEESNWSDITVSTLSNKPPIPENISGIPLSHSIKMIWTIVNGATGYEIRIDGGAPISVTESAYLHSELTTETAYTYEVRAIYIDTPGAWSEPVTVSTLPEPPSKPTDVIITSGNDAITVTWENVPNATSYEVETDHQIQYQGTETTFTMTDLSPGTQHMVSVRAINEGGASSWTLLRTVMTRTGADDVPENLSATSTQNTITLTWEAVGEALSYDIKLDDNITFNVGNQLTYTDTGIASGMAHAYQVRAQYNGGPGPWSPAIVKGTVLNTPVINADGNITDIMLSWDPIENAASYDIEIDGTVRTEGAICIDPRTTAAIYIDSNLEPDSEHTYRVRARNDVSVSEWSTTITAKTKSPTLTLNCTDGEIIDLAIAANNITNAANRIYTVVFNPDEVEVVDLCGITPEENETIGEIKGTNITITRYETETQGVIMFTINDSAAAKALDGVLNTIKFRSKINGETTVMYSVQ